MDVSAGVDVVKQVPARVVGIFVDDKIITAIPAPVRGDGPVPSSVLLKAIWFGPSRVAEFCGAGLVGAS